MSAQLKHSGRVYCDAGFHQYPFEATLSRGTLAELLALARRAGWRVIGSGSTAKTICPECAREGRKPRG